MEEEIHEYTVTYWMACWILYHMQRYTIITVKLSKCTQKLENIGFTRVRELFKFKRSIIHYINEPWYLVGLLLDQLFKATLFITTTS